VDRLHAGVVNRGILIDRMGRMSEQYRCNNCGYVFDMSEMMCSECGNGRLKLLRWTKGGDGSHWEGCEEVHWDCRIAQLEKEIDRLRAKFDTTDNLLSEATSTIGAVIACCTYNSNEDAKIGIYGIDLKAFTMIDQFITHYNDAVSAGKVSVDVKRELTDAEINELGAQEAEKRDKK
jgi:ribosomal protein L37E